MIARRLTSMLLPWLLVACQTSFSDLDGSVDSATDSTGDTVEDSTEDTVTDTHEDTSPDVDPDVDPPPANYVLHEWGVMVMGPEGASTHGPSPAYAGPVPAKPVFYLYAEEPLDLDLGVTFASGGPTEVWPETELVSPVQWNSMHVAPGPCDTTAFPSSFDDPWTEGYCEACTLGQVVVEDASCISHGDQSAKLLFYTGDLPDYQAPLQVDAEAHPSPDGVAWVDFTVENTTDRAVQDVWLVYRTTTDWCIDPSACPVATADLAWVYLESVGPYSGESLSVPMTHFEAEVDESGWPIPGTLGLPEQWLEQPSVMEDRLVARGLYPQEAEAFMNAWQTIFFGLMGSDAGFIEPFYSNGGSAIYFMSRDEYDEQLALQTSLAPTELVRVGLVYENM